MDAPESGTLYTQKGQVSIPLSRQSNHVHASPTKLHRMPISQTHGSVLSSQNGGLQHHHVNQSNAGASGANMPHAYPQGMSQQNLSHGHNSIAGFYNGNNQTTASSKLQQSLQQTVN